ncbi:hypothetical protein B7463_g9596, partial [Scytalidium lignicola]
MDMDMGSEMAGGMMDMAAGVPGLFYMQHIFWAFVGTTIGVAILTNVFNKILCYQRLAARNRSLQDPARPKTLLFKVQATLAAVIREITYYSPPIAFRGFHFYLPPMGPVIIMVAYVVLIVVCCFIGLHPNELLEWEDIGYRCGFIAVAQLPLIVLLAGKRNIIGFLTGMGYERLAWLHRWVARALLFTVLIHMGFWMREWGKYDYIMVKLKTDSITQRGIAAFGVLGWLMLSSLAPVRGLCYEFFVVQHVISWIGFLFAVYLHIPDENRVWIWIPLGFWAFDRVVRALYMLYTNLSFLHRGSSGFLACKATFEPLDASHTRIIIANPPVSWKAGQHVFLACHPLAPLSSHPFTIASLPEDGKMEFIVCAKKGATRRFFRYAEKVYPSLPFSSTKNTIGRSVLIDGPYSGIRPLQQFDSLLFFAGSTGATFTVPLMRDVIRRCIPDQAPRRYDIDGPAVVITRYIRFVWAVKKCSTLGWFANQFDQVIRDVESIRERGHDITVEIGVYITCDESFTSKRNSISSGCNPESSRAGKVQLRRSNSSDNYEKKALKEEVLEFPSQTASIKQGCCCRNTVHDEDAIVPPCCCSSKPTKRNSISSLSSSSSSLENKLGYDFNPSISLTSGRPSITDILLKTAEQARGEMGVVVCGPPGLVQCTRNAACKISDERAVHKGTGAQGIWVHAEGFGYA